MKKVALAVHAVEEFNLEIIKSFENLDYIHVDVMDGKFVNNTMLYLDIFQKIKKVSNIPVIAHLMVENPQEYVTKLEDYVDIFLFHYEINYKKEDLITFIKNRKKKVGIVINPETEINVIKPIFDKVDIILVMGVNPGWSGQKFLSETINKVNRLADLKKKHNFEIDVDGGVNLKNAKELNKADILSSSSTILKAKNPNNIILELKGIDSND